MIDTRSSFPVLLPAAHRVDVGIDSPGITLTTGQQWQLFELRGDPGDADFSNAVQSALGAALPSAGRVQSAVDRSVLWLRPNGWWIVGSTQAVTAGRAKIVAALGAVHTTLIDVSDAFARFELSGANARQLLARGCTLDLHPRFFGMGQCTRTMIADISVLIHRIGPDESYHLYVEYSVAAYFGQWLTDAAQGLTSDTGSG